VESSIIEGGTTLFNTSSLAAGSYIVRVSKDNFRDAAIVIISE
jgi:hypothetical protein